MSDQLTQYITYALVTIVIIGVMVAIGMYAVRKYRDHINQGLPDPTEMMTNFRELHQQGDISESEYRTIKTKLATELAS